MLELKDISFSVNEENTDKEILKDINLTRAMKTLILQTGTRRPNRASSAHLEITQHYYTKENLKL